MVYNIREFENSLAFPLRSAHHILKHKNVESSIL